MATADDLAQLSAVISQLTTDTQTDAAAPSAALAAAQQTHAAPPAQSTAVRSLARHPAGQASPAEAGSNAAPHVAQHQPGTAGGRIAARQRSHIHVPTRAQPPQRRG